MPARAFCGSCSAGARCRVELWLTARSVGEPASDPVNRRGYDRPGSQEIKDRTHAHVEVTARPVIGRDCAMHSAVGNQPLRFCRFPRLGGIKYGYRMPSLLLYQPEAG